MRWKLPGRASWRAIFVILAIVIAALVIFGGSGAFTPALVPLVFRATATPRPTRTPIPSRTPTTTPTPTATPLVQTQILVPDYGGRVDWSTQNIIAFSKFQTHDKLGAEIYTMLPSGENQTCLTCGKGQISHISNDQPAWASDGKYIVFQSVDEALYNGLAYPLDQRNALTQGGSGLDNNLWLITPDATQVIQLTTIAQGEGSLHPHFSPDGKTLYWASLRRGDHNIGSSWSLSLADFIDDVSGPHLVNVRWWQPLGTQFFYESHNVFPDNRGGLFSTDANPTTEPPCVCALNIGRLDFTSGVAVLLTNSTDVWQEHGQISPDGSRIVWASSQGYPFTPSPQWQQTLKTDLWMMAPDGSGQHQITWFNTPGKPEYHGGRTIVSDGSWNPTGDRYVVQMDVAVFPAAVSQVAVLTIGGP